MTRMALGRQLGRFLRDLLALAFAIAVLLACKISEKIELQTDGSGVARFEVFFEASEWAMMPNPRSELEAKLRERPQVRLVAEGDRDGGHFYVLEQIFEDVSELDGEKSKFRWKSLTEHDVGMRGTRPRLSDLFLQRSRLDLELGQENYQGFPPTVHTLEVTLPGAILETDGELTARNRVVWDRLRTQGTSKYFAVSQRWRFPGPRHVADWYVSRNLERYFEGDGLAWLQDGEVWVGDMSQEWRRPVAGAGLSNRIQGGGGRVLHYAVTEPWRDAAPVDATLLYLDGSKPPVELASVLAPRLSPDGHFVIYGKAKGWEGMAGEFEQLRSEGLWILDLESGEERLLAGELNLSWAWRSANSYGGGHRQDSSVWRFDRGTWSSDGKRLFLERQYPDWRWATFSATFDAPSWGPVVCGKHHSPILVSANQNLALVNLGRETHSYYEICDISTGELRGRSKSEWGALLEKSATRDGAFSPSGLIAIAVNKGRTPEGWPAPPLVVWVGSDEAKPVVALPEEVQFAHGMRWHPSKSLVLFGNALVDTAGTSVRLLPQELATATWVVAPIDSVPSLATVRVFIVGAYWLVVALFVAACALGARQLARRLAARAQPESGFRQCDSCGRRIEATARYCRHCGTKTSIDLG